MIATERDDAVRLTNWFFVASVLLLALQCGAAALQPAQGWITCVGMGGQLALSAVYCLARSRHAAPGLRRKWLLTALSFTIWAAGFGVTWWSEYVIRFTPHGAWAQDILFGLRGLPLLLAACWPEEDSMRSNRWIDVAQISLIAVLLMLLLFPGFTLRSNAFMPPLGEGTLLLLLDSANAITACVAVLACFAVGSIEAWAYHRALALFLCAYTVVAACSNHVVILRWDVPAGSPWFLLGSLSIMTFLAAMRFPADSAGFIRGREEIRHCIRIASTVVFAVVTFLLSVTLALRLQHATVGILLGVLSLLLYAARTASMEVRHAHAQHELAALNRSLKEISESDALTGTRNRRWFAQHLLDLWKEPAKHFPLTMLLIDVDHFKKFNDQHGHTHGDECLSQVAGVLNRELQKYGGVVARYGGEEFAVLLPATSTALAYASAQRICNAVQSAGLPHPRSPQGVVTVSVGVTTFLQPAPQHILPEIGATEMLFLLADAALYEAKRLGRNRTHAIHTV